MSKNIETQKTTTEDMNENLMAKLQELPEEIRNKLIDQFEVKIDKTQRKIQESRKVYDLVISLNYTVTIEGRSKGEIKEYFDNLEAQKDFEDMKDLVDNEGIFRSAHAQTSSMRVHKTE